MKKVHRISFTLLLLVALPLAVTCLTFQEDDLVFDDVGEDTIVSTQSANVNLHLAEDRKSERRHNQKSRRNGDVIGKHPVQRLWGVPDTVIPAGHVFKQRIPKQAFSGNVERYEVFEANGGAFPRWIYWDEPASTLLGVPSKRDVGNHHLNVKAFGKHNDIAKDAFLVEVVPERRNEMKHKDGKSHCESGEGQVLMNLFLDATYDHVSPLKKVNAIENLARYLGLHTSAFSIHPHSGKDSSNYDSSTLLFKGPGNIRERKATHQTVIQWQVGCNRRLWKHQEDVVTQLHDQAKDGTLAEVLELPVINWRVKADPNSLRNRREAGSGDYDIPEDYDGYDEEYDEDYDDREGGEGDDDNEAITEAPIQPSHVPNSNAERENSLEHPHRHHHGEEAIDWNTDELDEHEIVPVIDQRALGSTSNLTTTSPSTTTQLISRPSTNTPPSTALPTSNTTTTEVSSTLSSTIKTTTSMTSTTTETVIGPNTTTGATSTESGKMETTEESTEKTKRLETEVVTSTSVPDNATSTIPSVVTTSHSSTSAISSSTTDKVDIDATVMVNITTEEPMESTTGTSTRQPTTTTVYSPPNTTTSMIITSTPTALPSTTPTSFTSTSTHSTTLEITSPSTTPTITTSTTQASTTTPSTTTYVPRVTTENIEYGVHNFPPRKDKRLKKIPVTAGKPLSYIIPADTFNDLEDGNTKKLKLSLYLQGAPLKSTHWLQFNSQTQEVYGLPLENDISTWNYELVAADSEGLNVSDRLDIHVQQHKLSRTVNHEFSVYLRIDSRNEFPTDVDWELKVIRSLAELYDDTDTHHITVRSIDIGHDQAIFTWTNDSLPRSSECPQEHIRELLDVLVDENEEPSASLKKVLAPEMTVKRVVYQGIGQCERMNQPEVPKVPTQGPKVNFPPVPRNQVDHVNATVGQLLVFKVPEDTFFDAEDGSSRNMKMSLLSIDRTPIPQYEWLQFDSKNQEFYGVPLRSDIGRKEYQLVVTDRGGASATDGLVVVVHPSPPMHHTVEFSMTLDIPYESFAHSALQKRNFVEKLRELYRDKDTSAISLHSITNGSTVITWHNRTLPTTYCAHEDVNRLRSVLVKSDDDRRSVTDEVLDIMGLKFPVKQITVMPMGICLGELTGVHSPDNYVPPIDDSTSVGAFNDDYLITFVLPAIIIAAMLILAGIIACILYRRRRSGKMSVNEQDDERQSFRSKGIPVIFQDELDEKPDPGNKSPVILKEEKPPLPPPEYQKTEDGADVPMLPKENSEEPYQPPPPFATNRDTNRQNRPKPTPTYRKPPPYVPP